MERDSCSGSASTDGGSAVPGGMVCLAGPPGSGKSSAGPILAERLGVAFRDLDELIEAEAGRSIPEIFEAEGEAAFRRLDHTRTGHYKERFVETDTDIADVEFHLRIPS